MDRAYVIRKQLSLTLNYGTIRKSQGLSLQNLGTLVTLYLVVVYIALSRVTYLNVLYFINYDPSTIIASEKVIIKYNQLKQMHKPKTEIDYYFKRTISQKISCEYYQKQLHLLKNQIKNLDFKKVLQLYTVSKIYTTFHVIQIQYCIIMFIVFKCH